MLFQISIDNYYNDEIQRPREQPENTRYRNYGGDRLEIFLKKKISGLRGNHSRPKSTGITKTHSHVSLE